MTQKKFPDGKSMEERMFNMESKLEVTMTLLYKVSEQVNELVVHSRKPASNVHPLVRRNSMVLCKDGSDENLTSTNRIHAQTVSRRGGNTQTFEITIDHGEQAGECYMYCFLSTVIFVYPPPPLLSIICSLLVIIFFFLSL